VLQAVDGDDVIVPPAIVFPQAIYIIIT